MSHIIDQRVEADSDPERLRIVNRCRSDGREWIVTPPRNPAQKSTFGRYPQEGDTQTFEIGADQCSSWYEFGVRMHPDYVPGQ